MVVKASAATCPQEIADSKPAIVIVDTDDFKIDTMTGNATGVTEGLRGPRERMLCSVN